MSECTVARSCSARASALALLLGTLLVASTGIADTTAYGTSTSFAPPDGFVRIAFDEIDASFVHPDDWHVAFAKAKLMGSLVLTAPSSGAAGSENPPARFIVNAVSNLMRVSSRRVSEQVREFDRAIATGSNPRWLASTDVRHGTYVGRDLSLRLEAADGGVWRERRLYLAHDARDWLLIVRFTAPEADWTALAPVRHVMFDDFVLD